MPKVFISYRRADSGGQTGRLLDDLERRFGRDKFFRDIEDLEPGTDFPEALDRALSQCDAVLVMIGPAWASAAGQQGRRLEQAGDFVHVEVATALARKDVRVIPVLVGGATIPAAEELPEDLQALHRRNAIELSDTRWEYDVKRLGDALAKQLGLAETTTSAAAGTRRIWGMAVGGGIALVAAVLVMYWIVPRHDEKPTSGPSTAATAAGKPWAVVFGADVSREAAEDEIKKATKLHVSNLALYHGKNFYSAAVFDSKEKATSALAILQQVRSSAYPVPVSSLCKNAHEKDRSRGYVFYECS
jgi:hypothetical protein